ncbi:MAG: recombinase family protein [Romboutsia sp.]|uniref:recombinase family protein n=1 Tax=Romboutsia sp. TaxID=1965302 RepID=UPI003F371C0B
MTIYGYARCSTNESKQDITRQTRELIELGATKETIYFEYESGTKTDRVQLNRLLEVVQEGDTIVTTEVSRITRSTKQLCEIIELVQEKNLKLVLGAFVVDCSTGKLDPMTEGMLKMMGVFAEMERNMISQRVKSGMENAKAKGKTIGRKETTKEDIPQIFLKHYDKYKVNQEDKEQGKKPIDRRGINLKEFMSITDLSKNSIYKYIKLIEEN